MPRGGGPGGVFLALSGASSRLRTPITAWSKRVIIGNIPLFSFMQQGSEYLVRNPLKLALLVIAGKRKVIVVAPAVM